MIHLSIIILSKKDFSKSCTLYKETVKITIDLLDQFQENASKYLTNERSFLDIIVKLQESAACVI